MPPPTASTTVRSLKALIGTILDQGRRFDTGAFASRAPAAGVHYLQDEHFHPSGTCPHRHRAAESAVLARSWHLRQARSFLASISPQRAANPGGCGAMPPG